MFRAASHIARRRVRANIGACSAPAHRKTSCRHVRNVHDTQTIHFADNILAEISQALCALCRRRIGHSTSILCVRSCTERRATVRRSTPRSLLIIARLLQPSAPHLSCSRARTSAAVVQHHSSDASALLAHCVNLCCRTFDRFRRSLCRHPMEKKIRRARFLHRGCQCCRRSDGRQSNFGSTVAAWCSWVSTRSPNGSVFLLFRKRNPPRRS